MASRGGLARFFAGPSPRAAGPTGPHLAVGCFRRGRGRGWGRLASGGLAVLALAACGDEEARWQAFEVTLQPAEDCSQTGANAVQCVEVESLQATTLQGRWVFEYRGPDTFALVTEGGRVIPGVHVPNDGRLTTNSCTGQGGVCHFARARTDAVDPDTGCLRIVEYAIDVRVQQDALSGTISDVTFSDESCGTPSIRQVITEVAGTRLEEAVRAREEAQP